MFSGIISVMCGFAQFLLGPWVWVIGVFGIGMGGLALALEEGKLAKIVGGSMLGIGFVIAAPKIMDQLTSGGVANQCTSGSASINR